MGVVGVDNTEFVVADIPGLIEGASEGRGLGDLFLGHVERCSVLLHLVDGTSETVADDYQTIIHELEAYGGDLAEKPRVTVLNKIDALDEEERAEAQKELEKASGGPVMLMSGVAREGVTEVLRALRGQIDEDRLRHRPVQEDAAMATLTDAKRVVVKIGSALLVDRKTGDLRGDWLRRSGGRCDIGSKGLGCDVVLVSSGSIALGRGVLGLPQHHAGA